MTAVEENVVCVQIAAPPKECEANVKIIAFMASLLGIRKSSVVIDKGQRSHEKCIKLSDCKRTVEEVEEMLKDALGKSF